MILRITEKIVDDAIHFACEFCSGNHFSKYFGHIMRQSKLSENENQYEYTLQSICSLIQSNT